MRNDHSIASEKSSRVRSPIRLMTVAAATLAVAVIAPWAHTASASVPIQYDIDGRWQADASRPMQCSRLGEQVSCTMVNDGFSHSLSGSYTGPTSIHFFVTRRNRANNCVTYMDSYVSLTSRNEFESTWVARDSNCDLWAGQSGVDPTYYRL